MCADVISFFVAVQNWPIRYDGCSFVDFYSGSYQRDVKFIFWYPTILLPTRLLITDACRT